jgi:hypothetical protein
MQMLITTVRQSPRRPWRKVTVGGKVFVVGAGGHSVGVFL